MVALHTFLTDADRGKHILVRSDSLASVQVFRSGRGRNPVILDCARALWMIQAILDVEITYEHISGESNVITDALSRLHVDPFQYKRAVAASKGGYLIPIVPCTYIYYVLSPFLTSRSGVPIPTTKGNGPPDVGKIQGNA